MVMIFFLMDSGLKRNLFSRNLQWRETGRTSPGRHRLRPWEEPGHGARGRTRAEPRAGRLHSLWLFVASAPCAVRKIARISLLCHAQVKEFKELFDSLDNDGGGHIDVEELSGGICNEDVCCFASHACSHRARAPRPRTLRLARLLSTS